MMRSTMVWRYAVWVGMLCISLPILAQEFCATNSAELQAALSAAAASGQNSSIRVATGNYAVPAGGFVYHATTSGNLTLTGGWTEFFENPCGQVLDQNPSNTVLNGNSGERVLDVWMQDSSNVTVRLLTFLNGNAGGSSPHGGGLRIRAPAVVYAGNVVVERNMFMNNEADHGGGLDVWLNFSGAARMHVVNNMFVINHGRVGAGAARLIAWDGNEGLFGAGIFAINNTVLDNTSDNASPTGGMHIDGTVPRRFVINNNFWGNQGNDLRVFTPGTSVYVLANNNFEMRSGASPSSDSGNISVQPEYEPCFLCFEWVPVLNSPLVDAGTHPGLFANWWLPDHDLRGLARVNGGRVDIGAYENHDRFFSDRFEQP